MLPPIWREGSQFMCHSKSFFFFSLKRNVLVEGFSKMHWLNHGLAFANENVTMLRDTGWDHITQLHSALKHLLRSCGVCASAGNMCKQSEPGGNTKTERVCSWIQFRQTPEIRTYHQGQDNCGDKHQAPLPGLHGDASQQHPSWRKYPLAVR